MRRRVLTLAAAVVVALAGAPGSQALPAYRAVDLGPGWAFDVNSAGLVAGQSHDHAVVWTPTGGMVDLGTLGGPRSGADHVTEAGQVVGYAYVDATRWHAFSWTSANGMVDVGTLGGTGNSSPWDVSDAGQIVGQSNWAGFPPAVKAFSWTAAGGVVDPGMLRLSTTVANAVDEQGDVAGWSGHAFLWSQSAGLRDLGALAGSNFSVATDVNEHGQVVGYSSGPVDGPHAFSWTEAGGMIDLGRASTSWVAVDNAGEIAFGTGTRVMFLGVAGQPIDIGTLGGTSTTLGGQFPGEALNDAGQLVGRSTTADGVSHAFVWSLADGMIDLGTLGGPASQAVAISENGLIAGSSNAVDGSMRAVLWQSAVDTTPPSLTVADVAADATSSAGAVVEYTVTVADDSDPSPAVTCSPASGTVFAIGDTTVTCTATDASGNSASAAFAVHVRGIAELATRLCAAVQSLGLPDGLATSLCAKLDEPTAYRLAAFVHEVDAQTGKALTATDAWSLRTAAERIAAALGS